MDVHTRARKGNRPCSLLCPEIAPACAGFPWPQHCSLIGPALALYPGKSLKTLMSKGILQVHPPICDCPGCRISSPVVRCGRKVGVLGVFLLPCGACACFLQSRVLTSALPVCRNEPPRANRETLLWVGTLEEASLQMRGLMAAYLGASLGSLGAASPEVLGTV